MLCIKIKCKWYSGPKAQHTTLYHRQNFGIFKQYFALKDNMEIYMWTLYNKWEE